jgi:hypothetical protein
MFDKSFPGASGHLMNLHGDLVDPPEKGGIRRFEDFELGAFAVELQQRTSRNAELGEDVRQRPASGG